MRPPGGRLDLVEDLLDRAIAVETEDAATGYLRGFRARMAAARGEPYRTELELFLAGTPQDVRFADARLPAAARQESFGFWSPSDLITAGRAAMWEHGADLLPGLAARLDGEPGRVVAAVRTELLAGASALSGGHEQGRQRFVDAVRRWRDLGADFERALCQVSMVAVLGGGHPTADAADEARATFETLRATRFVDRLAEARSGSGAGVRSA